MGSDRLFCKFCGESTYDNLADDFSHSIAAADCPDANDNEFARVFGRTTRWDTSGYDRSTATAAVLAKLNVGCFPLAEWRHFFRDRWGLFYDTANLERYVETFIVESWAEHLRQHERATAADQSAQREVRAFLIDDAPVTVTHLIYAHVPRVPHLKSLQQ